MSVRILLGITVAALTGGADASSLVFPGTPSSTPSIVAPDAVPGKARDVVALGEPDVSYEKVAAVPTSPERHIFMPAPVIMRGGIVGRNATAPAQGTAPAAAPAPATASADSPPEAQKSGAAPAPSPQPAAAAQPADEPATTK